MELTLLKQKNIEDSTLNMQIDEEKQKIQSSKVLQRVTQVLQHIIPIVLLLTTFSLYQVQLISCPYIKEDDCGKFLKQKFQSIIVLDILASLSINLLIFLYFRRWVSSRYIELLILQLIYNLFLSGHDMTARNYQLLYQITYGSIILSSFLILGIIFLLRFLIKRFRMKFLLTFIFSFIVISLYFYWLLINSCQNWKLGLNHIIIVDTKQCKIEVPQYCWFEITEGLLDLSKYQRSCPNQNNPLTKQEYIDQLSEYIEFSKYTKYIEFPRTEKFPKEYKFMNKKQYLFNFLRNLKGVQTEINLSKEQEIYYDIENQKFKYLVLLLITSISIKRNDTLAKERSQIYEQNNQTKKPKNIITIWVDAVSRARFQQRLKKSLNKIEDIAKNKNYFLFQGMKYISIAPSTQKVDLAYEYGVTYLSVEKRQFSNWSSNGGMAITNIGSAIPSISELLRDNGYVIGKANSQCNSQIAEMYQEYFYLLKPSTADHEMIGISCDLNYQNPFQYYSIGMGPNSVFRRCNNRQDHHNYLFEYSKQFLNSYKNESKYLEVYLMDGHESTGQVLHYMDEALQDFLNFLSQEEHDKDSIIILMSDHGSHIDGLGNMFNWDIFRLERNLPGMFILFDKSLLTEEEQENLIENEQKLVQILDLHNLLKYYISPIESKYFKENSLLADLPDRTCTQIPLNDFDDCPCQ